MAIFYNYTITVNGNKASMDKNIYLYRKNKNVDYYFEIKNACFKFENEINYIISYNAEYARFKVMKPDGSKFVTKKRKVKNGYAKFSVTEDLIDERAEVGTYVFQIDLYDEDDGFITIPPIYNQFHVLEPLFDDSDSDIGQIDISGIDISYIGDTAEEVTIFDKNNVYIKTFWKTRDIISSVRMNKIEEALNTLSSRKSDIEDFFIESNTPPEDKDVYWVDTGTIDTLKEQSAHEGIIKELLETVRNLQKRILVLEEKVGSGIISPTTGDYLQLADGTNLQLADGTFLELSSGDSSSKKYLQLADGTFLQLANNTFLEIN